MVRWSGDEGCDCGGGGGGVEGRTDGVWEPEPCGAIRKVSFLGYLVGGVGYSSKSVMLWWDVVYQ